MGGVSGKVKPRGGRPAGNYILRASASCFFFVPKGPDVEKGSPPKAPHIRFQTDNLVGKGTVHVRPGRGTPFLPGFVKKQGRGGRLSVEGKFPQRTNGDHSRKGTQDTLGWQLAKWFFQLTWKNGRAWAGKGDGHLYFQGANGDLRRDWHATRTPPGAPSRFISFLFFQTRATGKCFFGGRGLPIFGHWAGPQYSGGAPGLGPPVFTHSGPKGQFERSFVHARGKCFSWFKLKNKIHFRDRRFSSQRAPRGGARGNTRDARGGTGPTRQAAAERAEGLAGAGLMRAPGEFFDPPPASE